MKRSDSPINMKCSNEEARPYASVDDTQQAKWHHRSFAVFACCRGAIEQQKFNSNILAVSVPCRICQDAFHP